MVAGGAVAVLVLAVGGYAFATVGSNGEPDSTREGKSVGNGNANGEGQRNQGVTTTVGEPDEDPRGEGDRPSSPERIQEPEPPESPPAVTRAQTEASTGGYIAQLGSFTDRAGAEARLARLQSKGAADGVLWSSDFLEMTPGYWVVFAGPFDSKALADEAAASSGIRDAFSRLITPE